MGLHGAIPASRGWHRGFWDMRRSSVEDRRHMQCALDLACRTKGAAFPNPAVGAVVVDKHGVAVGNGTTRPWGEHHAEVVALRRAGTRAAGGTLFVTLEPCAHHGRTPPCTQAIIESGISRVVIGARDPNPLVNGRGIRRLRRHGLQVNVGMMRQQAHEIHEDYLWSIRHQSPWVTLKLAMTLDGRIADINGDSRWITGKKARMFAHELRRGHAAVAVGSRTLLADNPHLTVRHVTGKTPARIVFSKTTAIGEGTHFRRDARSYRSIVVSRHGGKKGVTAAGDGVEVWRTGVGGMSESLSVFLGMAYENHLTSILVEGGARLASSFLESGLVNRVCLLYGNKILGRGTEGILYREGLLMDNAVSLDNVRMQVLDDDIMVTGTLDRE